MAKYFLIVCAFFYGIACSPAAYAGQTSVFVAEFGISGAQNKEELKGALPALLATRLSAESLLVVDQPAGADVTVTGTYVGFGKIFSLDVAARDKAGKILTRAFEQGGSQDELIPAMNKLAKKLATGIDKAPAAAPPAKMQTADGTSEPVPAVLQELIKPPEQGKNSPAGWVSQRLAGEFSGIAPGRTMANGDCELFMVGTRELRLYRLGQELKLLDQKSFPLNSKILSIDTADLDGDGVPEAFLTIMVNETLASQVWLARDGALHKVAESLPYYFRALSLAGGPAKIYAQQSGLDSDYYGDIHELEKQGGRYVAVRPFKLPRFGNLYNFNMFKDAAGKNNIVLLNEDGYLIVYSPDGEELWRSTVKFGGSQLYFQRESTAGLRITGDKYRRVFLQQRISVTRDGNIIIPQNTGFFVIGNNRSYNRSSVFTFSWNGSLLEEKWRTKEMESYLADYFFDQQGSKLVLLQIVSKEGPFAKGASMIAVRKVE